MEGGGDVIHELRLSAVASFDWRDAWPDGRRGGFSFLVASSVPDGFLPVVVDSEIVRCGFWLVPGTRPHFEANTKITFITETNPNFFDLF